MVRSLVLLSLVLLWAGGCYAQGIQDIDKREAALLEAWDKTPLSVRRALFETDRAEGFGQYKERSSNAFKPGEKLVAYVEPVGYGWKETSPGSYEFGFDVDFLIESPDQKLLAGQENFAKLVLNSHAKNREFKLNLTMSVSGAPPGDYILEDRLRDVTGDKATTVQLPFKIAK
jgi:hypothetical protein